MKLSKFYPKKLYRFLIEKYFKVFNRKYSKKKAIKLMAQEWNYLIILDACRYDIFKKLISKDVPYAISGGTTTQEWVNWNFNGKFNDTIYIAGNPHLSSLNLIRTFGTNPFFKVVELWDYGWDDNLKTVPPHEVTKATLTALSEYPNMKMIIHYNQPHPPFIGDMDLLKYYDHLKRTTDVDKKLSKPGIILLLNQLKEGKISIKTIWRAYLKTFVLVLKEALKLIQELKGIVIITSDHGELFGEYKLYGHHMNLRIKNLVKVPWFVIKDEKVRKFLDDEFDFKPSDKGILEMELIKNKIKSFKDDNKI